MTPIPKAPRVTLHSLRPLVTQTIRRWNDINAPRLGAALAFYAVLSIAPLLVLSVGIAGLVFEHKAVTGQIIYQFQHLIGYEGGKIIQALVLDAAKPARGVFAGAVGVLMLLFGASGFFLELRASLNMVWAVKPEDSDGLVTIVRERFFSFSLVLGIGLLLLLSLIVSTAISAAGKFVQSYLPAPEPMLHLSADMITFLTVAILFALVYKLVPDTRVEWRDVGVGAAVTSLLFSLGKLLIGLYLGKASVGSAYGAAGSLVAFLVWVYYSAQVFLLGAAFTHVFAERHGSRARVRAQRTARWRFTPSRVS
jgi:membrane protein